MTSPIHAANIEEYRFRKLLDAMLLTVDASGGCVFINQYDVSSNSCDVAYFGQHDALIRSAVRYSADVQQLNNVTANQNQTNLLADDAKVISALQNNCNPAVRNVTQTTVDAAKAGGGDCAFTYKYVDQSFRSTGLGNVMQDAQGVYIPSEGSDLAGSANENAAFFAPIKVDVLVCATIPPLIPQFGWMKFGNYVASARGAATNVMLEQDWLQPGTVVDAQRKNSQVFQPVETYTAYNPYDYYNVDFGGSDATAYNLANVFSAPIASDELDTRVGWWGPISITPYATQVPGC